MLQVRVKHNDVWGEWADRSINIVLCAADMTNSRQWEVREKPEFEPGYFKAISYKYGFDQPHHLVGWFDSQKAVDDFGWTWKRVEVTDVS
jgi:hypothetical protein